MDKYSLPKDWKYKNFDFTENPIAKYYSSLTDYGDRIKYSDITLPKNSTLFEEFDDYINIKKQDLKGITFEQILFFLKNIETKENQTKKDCLVELLNKNQIKYEEGLWDEPI
jgi:hypothetical protein